MAEADTKVKLDKLFKVVSEIEKIRAIGQTGDAGFIPKAGEGDIDIFVLGDVIPDYNTRKAIYDNNKNLYEQCWMNVCEGGDWGTGDIFMIDGIETMLMYFSYEETIKYMEEILAGKHLNASNGFYPIGRLATLKNINIIYERNASWKYIKDKLADYPEELTKKMVDFHLGRCNDEEDFGRAVIRKDVLFYHYVLEDAIDHYLQTLYALNKTYFPSRKRTKQYLDTFTKKPDSCYERLLEVIRTGSVSEDIEKSYGEWRKLVEDLKALAVQAHMI